MVEIRGGAWQFVPHSKAIKSISHHARLLVHIVFRKMSKIAFKFKENLKF
jgi:hypothetical protein